MASFQSPPLQNMEMEMSFENDRSRMYVVRPWEFRPDSAIQQLDDFLLFLAMSPDMRTYKEFKKTRCTVLWMPMTTENELTAMNDVEFKLPADELQSRVSTHGPNARLAFHLMKMLL